MDDALIKQADEAIRRSAGCYHYGKPGLDDFVRVALVWPHLDLTEDQTCKLVEALEPLADAGCLNGDYALATAIIGLATAMTATPGDLPEIPCQGH